jgi:hypothetical protein
MPEYFSHDYDAREDGKIIDLMGEHGWQGYGLFWGLVELLYKNGGKMRTQYKRIAFALNSHTDTIEDIVENYGLFQVKKDFFSSKSVNKRLKKRTEKSEVARANAYKRWNKDDADALQPQSNSNAKKERKVKDIKVKESKGFSKPTIEEVKNYCKERNKGVNPIKWFNHYTSNGWKVGKNPMKNWKAAVHTWEESDIEAPGKLPESKGTNLGGSFKPEPKSKTATTREEWKQTDEYKKKFG